MLEPMEMEATQVEQRSGRKRAETYVETLTGLGRASESLGEVAHDARNMVAALSLYCDLLEEPGVLGHRFSHYGQELRLVAAASRRLVEKLVALDSRTTEMPPGRARIGGGPIDNLAAELMAIRNLLSALAGPAVVLTVHADGGAQPVLLTSEDLTRVLVNLVKNAAEAMPAGGRIHLGLSESAAEGGTLESVTVAVEDNGPGIPVKTLERIFTSGYTTHGGNLSGSRGAPFFHCGLGLAITRSIVEAAGGRITAMNREPRGTRIEIELPVRKGCR